MHDESLQEVQEKVKLSIGEQCSKPSMWPFPASLPSSCYALPWQEIVFPFPMNLARTVGIIPDERKLIDLGVHQRSFPDARGDFL